MLLEETEAPMDFSRGSDISEFQHRRSEMEQFEHRKPEPQNYELQKSEEVPKGLDLSHPVLDRLSQRVIRLGTSKTQNAREQAGSHPQSAQIVGTKLKVYSHT